MIFNTFTKSNFNMKKWLLFRFLVVFLMIFTKLNAQTKLVTPPYLQKGDSIILLAPAGSLSGKEEILAKAKKLAESWGLHVVFGKHLFDRSYHFSATDKERVADFQKALDNPNIKAIWSGRGGYGTVRILDKLDFTTFKKYPKWIIGYSDITALHNHLHNLGFETMHAMMGVSMGNKTEDITETIVSFKRALFGKRLKYKIPSSSDNRKGKATGQLVGGNLTIIHSMLGSVSQISTDGKILFLEDIGEQKYRIDRLLQSLKRAGYFKYLKGLVIGDFSNVKPNKPYWGSSIEELILDVVKEYDFPVMFHFPAGHEKDNRALLLGRKVTMKVCDKKPSTLIFKQ